MRQRVLLLLIGCALVSSCSFKRMGINRMADALSSTATAFARDDDPEFVRLAAPSTLKMVEMLLDDQPSHAGLLVTACSGFAQYSYAFLQLDAEIVEPRDPTAARELRERAARMYARAADYCTRALEVRHPGVQAGDNGIAFPRATSEDVPAMYWRAVSVGGGLSIPESGGNLTGLIKGVLEARRLLARALVLDEDWGGGALHEAMIAVEGMPTLLGGSAARARTHFARAIELSGGQSAFAHVAMASGVALPARDRAAFEKHLRDALAIDVSRTPSMRLANLIAQRRARFLLSSMDRLFRR